MNYDLTSNLSMCQLEALDELKRRVHKELREEDRKDDALYLRFLRARDYNVDKAEVMLRNHIEWKKKNRIDYIIEEYEIPEVGKYFPMSMIGHDKEGSPVILLNFGDTDVKGLLKSAKKSVCVRSVVKHLETFKRNMQEESKKRGKHIETWNMIFNFENYSLSQATHKPSLELIAQLFMLYEANYPERLKNAIVVNASVYFTIMFAIVKPLLTGNTVSKIKIFGKEGYQEQLLKLMDADILPAYFGGTKTDPDGNPRCPSTVLQGGPVPHEYYFRSPERRLAYQPGVKKYSVSRKSKINIFLDVDEPGSQIEWEFETESRDIGFGLYFRESDNGDAQKPKELIPKQRVEAHLFSEAGMYKCDNPGTYILMFDNSYSWISQKDVFCRAAVVRPGN